MWGWVSWLNVCGLILIIERNDYITGNIGAVGISIEVLAIVSNSEGYVGITDASPSPESSFRIGGSHMTEIVGSREIVGAK